MHAKRRSLVTAVLWTTMQWLLLLCMSTCLYAADDLLTIEPVPSMQPLRHLRDPTLAAILKVPAFGTPHLARSHGEILSDRLSDLRIDLGDGHVVTAHKARFAALAPGISMWIGEIPSHGPRARGGSAQEVPLDENNAVLLVRGRDGITGSVRVNGQLYKLMPLQHGELAVVKVDESKLPSDDAHDHASDTDSGGQAVELPSATSSRGTISTIRLMVVASSGAVDRIGGEDAFQLLAAEALVEANQSFINGDLPVRFESAGVFPLSYVQSGDSSAILNQLKNPGDSALGAPVMRLRDEHRADLVVMLITATDVCGRAFQNANKAHGYSVVTWWCATGLYTVAHETGHNLAAHHSSGEASGGPFPYGAGYQQRSATPRWRTLMAAACADVTCNAVNYWSDPHRTYNGLPLGRENINDNARVLRLRAPVVAAFYPEHALPPVAAATATPSVVTDAHPVTLDGSRSSNPSGGTLRYEWVQTGGSPAVSLSNSDTAIATAAIPAVAQDSAFRFRLTVTNRDDLSDAADVTVTAKAPGGENCEGAPAWDANKVYSTYNERVSYLGKIYRQNFYNVNQPPDRHSAPYGEPWIYVKDCEAGGAPKPALSTIAVHSAQTARASDAVTLDASCSAATTPARHRCSSTVAAAPRN
jgi:hypothetical protein